MSNKKIDDVLNACCDAENKVLNKYFDKEHFNKSFNIIYVLIIIASIIVGIIAAMMVPDSVEEVSARVFETYKENKVYDSKDYIQIGEKYYRTDCSGYVDAVLGEMNIIDTDAASNAFMEDKDIKDTLTNAGFTYQTLTDAADINSVGIVTKNGLVAIIVPNNEYNEFTLYCWGSKQSTVKSLSVEQINKYGFTNIYSLNE